jgi:acetyl-CoA C-acetyltransferase
MKQQYPIIVGAGQITDHSQRFENAPHPLQLAQMAIAASVEDAECPEILNHCDLLDIVNITSWHYEDPPAQLSEMLGIKPAVAEYTNIGGNTPQWLVNRAADKIAKGEIQVAVIVGAEAMDFSYRALRARFPLPWPHGEGATPPMIGDDRFGSNSHEILHNAYTPIQVYPLFENALRKERGLGMEDHREFLSRFCAEFSKVAAENPLAWTQKKRSVREIGTATEENRIIGFPYTKFMNPIMNVNQSAACIMTSNKMAGKLNIPRRKWIYLHGGADATDKWFVSERINFTSSPAIEQVAQATFEMAGINLDDIDFFDLYSCFPSATVIGAKSLGLNIEKLPLLTITGGLAYFGGPGNNYTMHAIARAVEKLRKNPEQFGYISALGWFITKHSAGIYSGREPEKPWNRAGQELIQQKIDEMEGPELKTDPEGPAYVETYTIMHDRQGNPDYAIVVARLADGKRCWALTEKDRGLFECMESFDFIGKSGIVTAGDDSPNIIRF